MQSLHVPVHTHTHTKRERKRDKEVMSHVTSPNTFFIYFEHTHFNIIIVFYIILRVKVSRILVYREEEEEEGEEENLRWDHLQTKF
jgi:hypothetical protein